MPKQDSRLSFAQNFICGGNAGVVCRTVCSPLDVVKTLQQVGTADASEGMTRTFINQYKNEGIRAFYKGNLIACLRGFPYYAIQFGVYERSKQIYGGRDQRVSSLGTSVCGAMAGVCAVVMTYPLDMVKTRLTAQHADLSKAKYKGISNAFSVIMKEEGVLAVYKGMGTSIIGVIPFTAATFFAYENIQALYGSRTNRNPLLNFLDGCLAGAFAQTVSFPFDTIRKKLQAQSTFIAGGGTDVEFRGMLDGFRQTVRRYGVLGLWRGTLANLVKVVPYAGVMFMTFEATKRVFLYTNGYTESPFRDVPREAAQAPVSSYEVYRSEAEDLFRKAMFQKAIDSYTMALEIRQEDPHCLISRAQCFLKSGQNDQALRDTDSVLESNPEFHKAIYMKAECYYQIGNFEMALVFYHRGYNMRPDIEEFSLGIKKASEAIENSVGVPDAIRLKATRGGDYFSQDKFSKLPSLAQTRTTAGSKVKYDDPRLSKQLLEELYDDKEYLESLLKDSDICSRNSESGIEITNLVSGCLNYLNDRADFWLQHKPIYARERERRILLHGKNEPCKEKDINVIVFNKMISLQKKFEREKYDQVRNSAAEFLNVLNSHPRETIRNYKNTIVSVYNLIATSAFKLNDYQHAEDHYAQLLQHIEDDTELRDTKTRAMECITVCQMKGGRFEDALETLTKLLHGQARKDSGNETTADIQEIWNLHEAARCLYELDKLEEAEIHAKRAFDLAKSIYSGEWMLNTAVILAKISHKNKRPADSLEYYESALKLAKALNDAVGARMIMEAIEKLPKIEECCDEDIQEDARSATSD